MFKKMFLLVFAVLLLCVMFVACNEAQPSDPEAQPRDPEAPSTEGTVVPSIGLAFDAPYSGKTCMITGKGLCVDTAIYIPDKVDGYTVLAIAEEAFRGTNITFIHIPDSVTSIGSYAFYGCSSLTSITIGNSLKSIGEYAFCGCSSLVSITIPDSVTSIGNSAFVNCSSLTSITIPDSVTRIRNSAFSGCSGLTSITIPDSVTSIGDYAFAYCSSLTSITFGGTTAQWKSISKGGSWNLYVPATKVVCSDGTVLLK